MSHRSEKEKKGALEGKEVQAQAMHFIVFLVGGGAFNPLSERFNRYNLLVKIIEVDVDDESVDEWRCAKLMSP